MTDSESTEYVGGRAASPAQYLFSQAEYTLKRAEAEQVGRTLECMVAITLAAFAMEAFLNLLGEQTFVDKYGDGRGLKKWQGLEQRLSATAKLDLLLEMNHLSIDTDAEPYSLLSELFKYRNMVAHGKTWRREDVRFTMTGDFDLDDVPALTPPWFQQATPATARKYVLAVEHAADELLLRTGHLKGLRISDTGWATSDPPPPLQM